MPRGLSEKIVSEETRESVKPYRIVARLKNNRLWTSIQTTFPGTRTQREAARKLGVQETVLGQLLNLSRHPSSKRHQWLPTARKIAQTLREEEQYLFDPALYGRRAFPIVFEMDALPALQRSGLFLIDPSPDDALMCRDRRDRIMKVMMAMTKRESFVLMKRFGLGDETPQTLEEIGETLGVGGECIRQIEQKALRKLRHPVHARHLEAVV